MEGASKIMVDFSTTEGSRCLPDPSVRLLRVELPLMRPAIECNED
jgi:hypothetical protein